MNEDVLQKIKGELAETVQALRQHGITVRGIVGAIGDAIEAAELAMDGPGQGADKKAIVVAVVDWLDEQLGIKRKLMELLPIPIPVIERKIVDAIVDYTVEILVGIFNATLWRRRDVIRPPAPR